MNKSEDNLVPDGLTYNDEFMGTVPFRWRTITFWTFPALMSEILTYKRCDDPAAHWQRVEVYAVPYTFCLERRLIDIDPNNFQCHSLSIPWDLRVRDPLGNIINSPTELPYLQDASFPELIAALGFLAKNRVLEFDKLSKKEQTTMRSNWLSWLNIVPKWLAIYAPLNRLPH